MPVFMSSDNTSCDVSRLVSATIGVTAPLLKVLGNVIV